MLACEDARDKGLMRRWARTLAAEAGIIRCNARRKRLAEEWRCSILADDIRFGLRLGRSPRYLQRG